MQDRILAVDYGSKRIGLAVTDPLGMMAQPLPYILNRGEVQFITDLKGIIQEKSVKLLVMGLPTSLDGSLGAKALEIQRLSERIQKECAVPVKLYDERFTSREAEDILVNELDISRKKRKELRDSMAACLILKYYLSAKQ